MIYKSQNLSIDLDKTTRIYPAVILHVDNEEVQVSLEWAELKKDQIDISYYALIFDFDKLGSEITNRQMLKFDNQESLINEMKNLSKYL
jgi:hypothetical protein